MDERRELGSCPTPPQSNEVLFGGHQDEAFSIGFLAQGARLFAAVAMMIGKAARARYRNTSLNERCKEFVRISDPGKRKHSPAAQRSDKLLVRPKVRPQDAEITFTRLQRYATSP